MVKHKNDYLPPSRAKNAVSFTFTGTTSHLTNTAYSFHQIIFQLYLNFVCERERWNWAGGGEIFYITTDFYILLTVHLEAILDNNQLDALFLNVFIYSVIVDFIDQNDFKDFN